MRVSFFSGRVVPANPYRGPDRLKKGDVMCLPCEEFLKNLHPDKLPDA